MWLNLSMCQVPERCERFCRQHVKPFARDEGLRCCFVAHLTALWSSSLINSETVDDCMKLISAEKASMA